MITAIEAFNLSLEKTTNLETIDALLVCESRIKEAVEKGFFAAWSDPLLGPIAEKLSIELEEFGYNTNVVPTNMYNDKKEPLAAVQINWRYKPAITSRVEAATSFN